MCGDCAMGDTTGTDGRQLEGVICNRYDGISCYLSTGEIIQWGKCDQWLQGWR